MKKKDETTPTEKTTIGWWTLSFTGVPELSDSDLENIANLIKQGYREGQVVQEEELESTE